jgi:transposase InsO family protein
MSSSMSRRGNCHDNAAMESFFSTAKFELGEFFGSHGEAKMELFDYIEVSYNQRRRHSTIGLVSPAVYFGRFGAQKWESERRIREEGQLPHQRRVRDRQFTGDGSETSGGVAR